MHADTRKDVHGSLPAPAAILASSCASTFTPLQGYFVILQVSEQLLLHQESLLLAKGALALLLLLAEANLTRQACRGCLWTCATRPRTTSCLPCRCCAWPHGPRSPGLLWATGSARLSTWLRAMRAFSSCSRCVACWPCGPRVFPHGADPSGTCQLFPRSHKTIQPLQCFTHHSCTARHARPNLLLVLASAAVGTLQNGCK